MLYGILMFLVNMPSRRAANRELGSERVFNKLRESIPELMGMPHCDTLARLLAKCELSQLEERHEGGVSAFVRSDAFAKLAPGRFLAAVDGVH